MALSINSQTDQYSADPHRHGARQIVSVASPPKLWYYFEKRLLIGVIISLPDSRLLLCYWNSPNPPAVPTIQTGSRYFFLKTIKQEAPASSKCIWFLLFWNGQKAAAAAERAITPPATRACRLRLLNPGHLPAPTLTNQNQSNSFFFFICRLSDNAWRIP